VYEGVYRKMCWYWFRVVGGAVIMSSYKWLSGAIVLRPLYTLLGAKNALNNAIDNFILGQSVLVPPVLCEVTVTT
jgi:hypothetical protein